MFRYSRTLPPELREIDPEDMKQWEAVANAVTARVDGAAQKGLADKAIRASSPAAKVIFLRKMADSLGAAAAPFLPCTSGCSDCCSMPVVIGEAEAVQIAKATGAKMRKRGIKYSSIGDGFYSGTPCTFLVGGKCSIYEHRPYACRVHFVVHSDNSRCKIVPGVPVMAPNIDVDSYHRAYGLAFGTQVAATMADVREYFPDGLAQHKK